MFDLYFDPKVSATMWLFTMILIVSSFIGYVADKYDEDSKRYKIFFLVSYLFLLVFYVFNETGTDMIEYHRMFETFTGYSDCKPGIIELGYQYLNASLQVFTKDPIVGVSIIRAIQLTLYFIAIYILRHKISLGFTLFAFVTTLYFLPFNILRMGIAFSLTSIAYAFYVKDKKILSIAICIASFFIHRSSIFFLMVFALFLLYTTLIKIKSSKTLIISSVAIIIILYFSGIYYLTQFVGDNFAEGRYSGYLNYANEGGLGLGLILKYLPMTLIFMNCNAQEKNSKWWIFNLFIFIMSIGFSILGYQMPILMRSTTYFSVYTIFYLSYYFKNRLQVAKPGIMGSYPIDILFKIYLWYLFILSCSGTLFKTSGLEDYHFFEFN